MDVTNSSDSLEPMPGVYDYEETNGTLNESDYYYVYEYYDDLTEEEIQIFHLVSIVIGYVLVVLIAVLNCLVIALLYRHGRDKSRVHFFILHLAIADLLVGIISVLSDTINHTVGKWLVGDVACRLYFFVGNTILYASNNLLIGMSVDRFLAVAAPMRSVRAGTHMCKVFVAGSWALSVLVNVFYLVFSGTKDTYCEIQMPEDWWKPYIAVVFVAVYVLPALTIIVCYTSICVIIWRKWRLTKNMSTSGFHTIKADRVTVPLDARKESRIQGGVLPKAKVKSIKMTVAICLAFLLCWSPFFFQNLLTTYGIVEYSTKRNMIINMLYPLNSVANPLIFIFFNMRLFTAKSRRQRSTASGSATTTTMLNNAVI